MGIFFSSYNTYETFDKEMEPLDIRMKNYEVEIRANKDLPLIAYIKCHNFKIWSQAFKKPYDGRISSAMVSLTEDLIKEFSAVTGYTCHNEITLVFSLNSVGSNYMHNGKLVKLASLLAGYASAQFNKHIIKECTSCKESEIFAPKVAYFSAKVNNVPDTAEALNNILWRSKVNCKRNSVSIMARHFLSKNVIQGMKTHEMINKMKEIGIDYEKCPGWFKHGVMVKKQNCLKVSTEKGYYVRRKKLINKVMPINGYSEGNVDIVFEKVWRVGELKE